MRAFLKNQFFYTRRFLAEYSSFFTVIFVVVGTMFFCIQIWNFAFCALPFGEYRVCF